MDRHVFQAHQFLQTHEAINFSNALAVQAQAGDWIHSNYPHGCAIFQTITIQSTNHETQTNNHWDKVEVPPRARLV